MNKKIYIIMLSMSFAFSLQAQSNIWDYPIKPGMEKWKNFKSIDEMYSACQIPDSILIKLNTETLVQICYNYPAYNVLFLYNSPQDGFDNFYFNFNGIRELLNRQDCGYYLLKKYTTMTVSDFNSQWELEKQGQYVYKYEFFETILAQSRVIISLNPEERIGLLKETIKKFEIKQAHRELFGGNSLGVVAWIMAKTLSQENKLSMKSEKTMSLKSGLLENIDLQSIYEQSKEFIK